MAKKNITLAAKSREKAGKGAARALRREDRVPAVIYGGSEEPVLISFEEKELTKMLYTGTLFTSLCDLDVDGTEHLTIARDVQLDPVTDIPVHADFLRVTERTRLTVDIPVEFINEDKAPGLEDEGGVLNIVRHELAVVCRATLIPETLTVDLTGYSIGDSIPLSVIKMDEGVELLEENHELTVATIAAPSALLAAEDEEEEGEEGEEGEGEEGEEGEGEGGEEASEEDKGGDE